MTGRQRVMAVLDGTTPDTIPFDLGGTDCSSIHCVAYKRLREKMGLATDEPVTCGCLTQLIADVDEDVRSALKVDAETLCFRSQKTKVWHAPFGVDLLMPEKVNLDELGDGSTVIRNAAGQVVAQRAVNSCYFDPAGTPLASAANAADINAFDDLFERWDYSAVYDEPLDDLAARAKEQYTSTDRAVVAPWRLHYLQSGQILRGYEQFLVDLMVDKDMAHALLQKLHDVYMKRVNRFLASFKDYVDVVFLTDDLGTQQAGMISTELYREMIYPYWQEIIAKIKAAGKKVIMHSCGAIASFIPMLIEMGVDALNPVQVSAAGMSPRELVREFGKDIAFWGGGCDTQSALNADDPEVVRTDVRRRLEEFGDDARLVFTQVHNVQYDVSAENILAMQDEFMKRTR